MHSNKNLKLRKKMIAELYETLKAIKRSVGVLKKSCAVITVLLFSLATSRPSNYYFHLSNIPAFSLSIFRSPPSRLCAKRFTSFSLSQPLQFVTKHSLIFPLMFTQTSPLNMSYTFTYMASNHVCKTYNNNKAPSWFDSYKIMYSTT